MDSKRKCGKYVFLVSEIEASTLLSLFLYIEQFIYVCSKVFVLLKGSGAMGTDSNDKSYHSGQA